MAKLTACFALSAVLALATGICYGSGQTLLEEPFPTDPVTGCLQFGYDGNLPLAWPVVFDFLRGDLPPLRIVSRADPSLSIAADDNGNAVLAKTNCSDLRQLWVQHFPHDENRFALVNFPNGGGLRAMYPYPKDVTSQMVMKLVNGYGPYEVPAFALWTQDPPLFGDGFSKIRSCYEDQRLVLDGLYGNVHEGTVVGAYPAYHYADNVLWKIQGF